MGAVRLGPGSRGGRVLVALALARDYLGVDSNKTSSSRTRKINRAEPEEPTHDWESVSWRHEWIQLLSRHVLGPVCETYGRSTLSRHEPRPRRPRVEAIVRYLASVCGARLKKTQGMFAIIKLRVRGALVKLIFGVLESQMKTQHFPRPISHSGLTPFYGFMRAEITTP